MMPDASNKPTQFTEELAAAICTLVMEGMSLRAICRMDGMPTNPTVYRWIAERPDFAGQYARATDVRAELVFDEIFDIADDAHNDWMERHGDDDDGWVANGEHIQRSKLRIDARKWALARMNPRKYGEKLGIGGAAGLPPMESRDVSSAEVLREKINAIAKRRGADSEPAQD